jgi:hypothetical protein
VRDHPFPSRDFVWSAEVAGVTGGGTLPDGNYGGAASSLRYRIVIHGPDSTQVFENVEPKMNRYPDAIDTIAAPIGSPVGIGRTQTGWYFLVDEKVRIDEECEL